MPRVPFHAPLYNAEGENSSSPRPAVTPKLIRETSSEMARLRDCVNAQQNSIESRQSAIIQPSEPFTPVCGLFSNEGNHFPEAAFDYLFTNSRKTKQKTDGLSSTLPIIRCNDRIFSVV